MYTLTYTEKSVKQLEKLEHDNKERIIKTLERVRIRPEAYLKKLVSSPYYKLRTGDYRIIIDLQQEKIIILVLEIGHRKNVYD